MRDGSRYRRFVPITPVAVPALLFLVLILPSCTSMQREPQSTPSNESRPPVEAARSDPAPALEPIAPVDEDPDPDAPAAALEEPGDEPSVDEPLPGEELSTSPVDELAEITPEITADELERERDLVADGPPSFDIPIVTNDKVMAWVDYYSNQHPRSFIPGLARGGRYLTMFREVFEAEGLPTDLVYMAHVESAYKTSAYSRAKARGLWQFIAGTGRRYGLRIDYWVDERLDPVKSTHAAAAYLKDLHAEFDDWYLALAGYNAGEGKIRRAIRRTGSRDFWKIARSRYIRRETKNYVPAILAVTMISKEPAKYGLEYVPDPPIEFESIEVQGAVDLRVLARCAGSDVETLHLLNPALRRYQTPPGATMDVHVPPGSGEKTLAALRLVPQGERVLYARHQVQPGDTLSDLAGAYGVTVSAIQQANRMGRSTLIRVGRELVIPTAAYADYPGVVAGTESVSAPDGVRVVYRVRSGDTLYDIARRHRTSPGAIAAASGIDVQDTLHPGDRLEIVPGARSAAEASRIARAAPPSVPARGGGGSGPLVHTVRRGDTLWKIALQYRTTVDTLCSLNRISRATTIHPGTQLTVSSD